MNHTTQVKQDFVLEHQWDVFVTSPEEREGEQPNRMPILNSMYETELEEVSAHERFQHQTKKQRLIPSPLQNNERL